MNRFIKCLPLFLIILMSGCSKEKVYRKYENGHELYFNPTTGEECYQDELVENAKNGCMKWYAFNDSKYSNKVKLLLDHNTTSLVAWNEDNGNDPDTILNRLKEDTKDWQVKSRLITVKEITKIIGLKELNTKEFNIKYHLHSYDENSTANEDDYVWLFNNTYDCSNHGCENEDYNTYGYWTDTLSSAKYGTAWVVSGNAMLGQYYVKYADLYGVRPVIEVDKSIF